MSHLRFGVLDVPDARFPALVERWRRVEELGFDFLFVADHHRHTRAASLPWFDGWTVLAAMAVATERVRIGPLVANPVLRSPAVMAKAAVAVDHLSDGRLELAIGKGVEEFDHMAVGEPYWTPAERSARFREYVEIVHGLLRSGQTPFSFEGRYYRTYEATVAPGPVQRPQPPITVGGQSPSVRRIAAERADCWNTFALGAVPFDEIVETVQAQNRALDEQCVELDRDPATLRRSLVCWKPLDPWERPDAFERIVASFREVGVSEFHVMWPGEERLSLLDSAAATIASLRAGVAGTCSDVRAASAMLRIAMLDEGEPEGLDNDVLRLRGERSQCRRDARKTFCSTLSPNYIRNPRPIFRAHVLQHTFRPEQTGVSE